MEDGSPPNPQQPRAVSLIAAVLLGGGLVALTVGCGQTQPPIAVPQQATSDNAGAAQGPTIEAVPDIARYFEMLRLDAFVYRYSGGELEFWLEIETDGKKESSARLGKLWYSGERSKGKGVVVVARKTIKGADAKTSAEEEWQLAVEAEFDGREATNSPPVEGVKLEEWQSRRIVISLPPIESLRASTPAPEGESPKEEWPWNATFGSPGFAIPFADGDKELQAWTTAEKISGSDSPPKERRIVRLMCRPAANDNDSPAK